MTDYQRAQDFFAANPNMWMVVINGVVYYRGF